jgi:hypothetical protein
MVWTVCRGECHAVQPFIRYRTPAMQLLIPCIIKCRSRPTMSTRMRPEVAQLWTHMTSCPGSAYFLVGGVLLHLICDRMPCLSRIDASLIRYISQTGHHSYQAHAENMLYSCSSSAQGGALGLVWPAPKFLRWRHTID